MNIGKYNVILADPPWLYERGDMHDGSSSLDHYPSMTLEQMSEMKDYIDNIIDKQGCVLYMWTTGHKMDTAIKLGQNWGFQFSQVAFVWDKMRTLAGCYTITECEFVLVFKRKNVKLPKREKTNCRQFFQEKPREHSRKPEYVQDCIEQMYPNTNKIELFARRTRPNWEVMGNETNKFDSI